MRRLLVGSATGALLLGMLVFGNVSAGAATSKYHLLVHTVDGEGGPHSEYKCGFVFTTLGASSLVNRFTVSVVNAKGKVDKSARGAVTVAVSPISSESACGLQSLDFIGSTALYNASMPVVHGVATFTNLSAAQPGSYVIDFNDAGLINTGPWVLLDVAGPNDPTSQVGPTQITITPVA